MDRADDSDGSHDKNQAHFPQPLLLPWNCPLVTPHSRVYPRSWEATVRHGRSTGLSQKSWSTHPVTLGMSPTPSQCHLWKMQNNVHAPRCWSQLNVIPGVNFVPVERWADMRGHLTRDPHPLPTPLSVTSTQGHSCPSLSRPSGGQWPAASTTVRCLRFRSSTTAKYSATSKCGLGEERQGRRGWGPALLLGLPSPVGLKGDPHP